ncbi:MAG: hypothetical protein C5B50_16435 [Verrucomicrobia bacterium]|nr:MAG: hypothetical protein C5B50_16435 [Verrucomicrobiota bacterium]
MSDKILIMLLLVLLVLAFSTSAQNTTTSPEGILRLAGIINLPSYKRAVIELPSDRFGRPRIVGLGEGERSGEIKLSEINPAEGYAGSRHHP